MANGGGIFDGTGRPRPDRDRAKRAYEGGIEEQAKANAANASRVAPPKNRQRAPHPNISNGGVPGASAAAKALRGSKFDPNAAKRDALIRRASGKPGQASSKMGKVG